MPINSLTNQILEDEIVNGDSTSLVNIVTNSCPNCNVMKPFYKESANDNAEVSYYELNANDDMALAKKLKIFGVPTTMFYRHGVLIHKKTGVINKDKIDTLVKEIDEYTKEQAQENKYRSFVDKVFRRK